MIQKLLGLPINASAHGGEIDFLIWVVHILMAVLFVGWGIFFTYVLIRFRRSRNPRADHAGVRSHTSNYIEIGVAVVEAILLIGFSIPFWAREVNALPPKGKDLVEVRVVAEQFAWNIHYPGPDGVFGRTDMDLVDQQTNPVGLDTGDPNAQDDIVTLNQLHLPVNQTAMVYLSSKDVVHSFALPEMRVKQDVIPGMEISTWFRPVKTGDFEIACAQLCGLGHYRMRGYLTIETREDFDQWLAGQQEEAEEEPVDDFWN